MRNFSDILNEALEKQERTKAWLSSKTGISSQAIGDYCKGKSIPSFDRAMLIANILKIDLSEFYEREEVKNIQVKEEGAEYKTLNLKREGVVEVPLFPSGAELLAAVTHSKMGCFIDVSMAREKTVVAEALAHDRVFAAKIDHLYDADDELGDAIVVWPLDAEGLKNNSIVLLANNPPSKFYIRRLALAEEDRLILKSPIDEESAIDRKDQRIIGKIKAAINFYE